MTPARDPGPGATQPGAGHDPVVASQSWKYVLSGQIAVRLIDDRESGC
jgi:hypothetical protein